MLLKRIVFLGLFLLSVKLFCFGQATWIAYPGDYDIWLGNNVNNRRTERGAFFPPFWKMDSHYVLVEFSKEFDLKAPEEIRLYVEGRYNVKLDGKLQNGTPSRMMLPEGKHVLNIKVNNQACVPAIYVEGKTVFTDSSWKVTFEDKEWIDESGKASDKSATVYMNAAALNFNSPEQRPSLFRLNQKPMNPLSITKTEKGTLVDFGKETFGYVTFHQLRGKGEVRIYYGESREEAFSVDKCETLDKIQVNNRNPEDLTLTDSKAFRYVYIENEDSVRFENVSMKYEYAPLDYRGSFRCNDEEINHIWDVAAYTLHLTTREVFLDGIKRDRWAWSGDAVQSYLMNYYLFFDKNTVTRTINMLRGKDPVTSHVNTIMDYTFYWFMSIYDYYLYTGDLQFIRQIYPRMVGLMDFVRGRTNAEGMVEGLSGDWVFVDWADGFMDKRGELSFEQLLFCKSLQTMALCAGIAGNQADKEKYAALGDSLFAKLETCFWDESKQAFVHNRKEGMKSEQVTRYGNIFAVLFDYVDDEKKQAIKKNVLLNDSVMKITTPYMRFYELASLCALGEQPYVTKEIKAYWGGMLKLGATSFWEKYNPEEKGSEHYAMYGRPFGKSLCHAWGASPLYLLGKYYLGVSPVKPGYEEFSIEPSLGGLEWIKGSVPTPYGDIRVFMDKKTIKVVSPGGKGYLKFRSKGKSPKSSRNKIERLGNDQYRIPIPGDGMETVITF